MDGVGLHAHACDDDACADRCAAQDVVDDARHADRLEDHGRACAVERRSVGRVDGRGGAHRLGQLASRGRIVSRDNGFHAPVAKPGDDRDADRPAAQAPVRSHRAGSSTCSPREGRRPSARSGRRAARPARWGWVSAAAPTAASARHSRRSSCWSTQSVRHRCRTSSTGREVTSVPGVGASVSGPASSTSALNSCPMKMSRSRSICMPPVAAEALDLVVELKHVCAVLGEMQVRAADSACLHADEDLPRAGNRLGHVVAQHHATIAKDRGAHQLSGPSARSAAILSSSVCSLMALTMASPARPRS